MGGILAVAARELNERWTVLIAAMVAGLVALLVPLFSSLGRHDARDARELAAVIFAAVFAFGLAIVVGSGMINRELVERRHGFFFSRPLSAGAIWGGKLLACWLLAVASGLVVLLPTAAVSRGVPLLGSVFPFGGAAATLGGAAGAILVVALFAHAFTLMVRSHVPWLLALDAVLAVGVATTIALVLRSLVIAYALDALTCAAVTVAVCLLVAPLAGGFVQVSLGRTDIQRGHRVMSVTLWGILGVAALLLFGYSHWVQAVSLSELTTLDSATCAPKGEWAFVTGRAQGRGDYEPSFLVDTASGRAVRLGAAGRWWLDGFFSADGTRAVWLSPPASFTQTTREVITLDLTDPNSAPVTTPITFSQDSLGLMGLSPDGHRLALRTEKTISVLELLTGRLLASVRLPEDLGSIRLLWRGSDRLCLAAWKPPARMDAHEADLRLFELDVSRRTLTATGCVVDVEGFWSMGFDARLGHIVTTVGPPSATTIIMCDARSGARIATLAACSEFSACKAAILSNGAVAVGEALESGVRLTLFSEAGRPERTIELGTAQAVVLAAQPTPATLVVTMRAQANDYSSSGQRTVVVDVEKGTVTPLGRRYRPLRRWPWWEAVVAPSPGSLASRAFVDPDGRLAILDPATNAFRTVLSARWHTE